MVWSVVHWAITVVAIGVVAGLVLAAVGAVAFVWLKRRVRRSLESVAQSAAGNLGRKLAARRIGPA